MYKKIIGIDPRSHTDIEGIKAAGIEWVRQGFRFPFQDKLYGERSEGYRRDVELAHGFVQQGLKVMGITPLAGVRAFDSAKGGAYWQSWFPDWAGSLGSATYQQTYELACAEIARETADLIDLWQIGNEMDIEIFRGPLTLEEAADFMVAGARGVKQGNPKAKTSINPAELSAEAIWFFQKLYATGQNLFDYAGIDGYWGSWSPGSPNTFREAIDGIYAITQVPVLFHEWGYTSLGGAPRPKAEGQSFCDAGGVLVHLEAGAFAQGTGRIC